MRWTERVFVQGGVLGSLFHLGKQRDCKRPSPGHPASLSIAAAVAVVTAAAAAADDGSENDDINDNGSEDDDAIQPISVTDMNTSKFLSFPGL